MTRITVTLKREERAALIQLAENERRDERAQAAWLIRQQLEKLGLLQSTLTTEKATNARQTA